MLLHLGQVMTAIARSSRTQTRSMMYLSTSKSRDSRRRALSKSVLDRLSADKKADLSGIRVYQTMESIAERDGEVLDARQYAVKFVWKTPGLRSVVKNLEVQKCLLIDSSVSIREPFASDHNPRHAISAPGAATIRGVQWHMMSRLANGNADVNCYSAGRL